MAETNDILRIVRPEVGGEEIRLAPDYGGYPATLLSVTGQVELEGGAVEEETFPGLLIRFAPTDAQRLAIARGQDVYLMLVTREEPPLEVRAQVGPGEFLVESPILAPDGEPARANGKVRAGIVNRIKGLLD